MNNWVKKKRREMRYESEEIKREEVIKRGSEIRKGEGNVRWKLKWEKKVRKEMRKEMRLWSRMRKYDQEVGSGSIMRKKKEWL